MNLSANSEYQEIVKCGDEYLLVTDGEVNPELTYDEDFFSPVPLCDLVGFRGLRKVY